MDSRSNHRNEAGFLNISGVVQRIACRMSCFQLTNEAKKYLSCSGRSHILDSARETVSLEKFSLSFFSQEFSRNPCPRQNSVVSKNSI